MNLQSLSAGRTGAGPRPDGVPVCLRRHTPKVVLKRMSRFVNLGWILTMSTSLRVWWLAAALLVCSRFAPAASTLNFPKLVLDSRTFTGLAIANPSAQEAVVTLTAFGPAGEPLSAGGFTNPATVT